MRSSLAHLYSPRHGWAKRYWGGGEWTLLQLIQSLKFNFLIPPGTHHCWADRGGMIWEACPTPLHMAGSVTRVLATHPSINWAQNCLTSVIWRELVASGPCAKSVPTMYIYSMEICEQMFGCSELRHRWPCDDIGTRHERDRDPGRYIRTTRCGRIKENGRTGEMELRGKTGR